MRGPLVGHVCVTAPTTPALPDAFYLAAQRRNLVRQLEHRLVLLGDMSLQISDFLLKARDAFVHGEKQVRPQLP